MGACVAAIGHQGAITTGQELHGALGAHSPAARHADQVKVRASLTSVPLTQPVLALRCATFVLQATEVCLGGHAGQVPSGGACGS